jgi:DNA-binding response OmpR family regulator
MYKKILAVDDDADMLEFLNTLLVQNGYEVQTLSQGEKVFNAVATFKPDLILMDVMLGGMDGSMICSALKANPDTKHIPVISISGYYHAGAKVFNDNEGAPNDFLLKPFSIKSLISMIKLQLAA